MRGHRLVLALFAGLVCLPGCVTSHDRRTVGSVIDDQAIEFKIGRSLLADKELESVNINATSINGMVLLTGEAPTTELRDRVLAAVRTVAGVRRTVNEVHIAPASPASSRANDSWLTSKVKAKLIGLKNFDSSQIKIVTERATVYLMGLVKKDEADLAATTAAEVGGVERVVKIFEYLD